MSAPSFRDDRAAEAQGRDQADPLAPFRSRFHIPVGRDGREAAYFCGNSLGLQPRGVDEVVAHELEAWREIGVEGHFMAKRPWYSYHERFAEPMAAVVGALPSEVVLMNSLTVNLHLMLASFYRPSGARFRVLAEEPIFPSDRYALESHVGLRGHADALVWVRPRAGEDTLRMGDVVSAIEEHRESLALVFVAGVNYLTGQVLDMARVAAAAREAGALVGFDLAHAAGNVAMSLHDWGVDFAVWCLYKYLNCGPGAVGAAFVHQRHGPGTPRLAGWWGNDPATRFAMAPRFAAQPGAAGWQLSNAPVLGMAPAVVALPIFVEAGMERLAAKSRELTDFLLGMLDESRFQLVTPREERGGQLSLRCRQGHARELQGALAEEGVVCDFRAPDILRLAMAPLYNTFADAWRLIDALERVS